MAEKEYIERKAAYPIASKVVDAITNGEYHAGVFAYDIMDWIDDIPAADVRPVVRGEWIKSNCHLFDLDENGKIDHFALDFEYHNGPHCKKCDRYVCEHCEPDYLTQSCEVVHYVCPKCGEISMEAKNFCPNCGADMREINND